MVMRAGLRRQRRRRVYLRIVKPVEVREGNKLIGVEPADRYSVAYTIDFPHPLIGVSSFEVDLSDGAYRREIAAARTFGFLRDERTLRNMGLIRGVSPENCVVLTDTEVANPPLRFSDEFVRHKVLDLIGDLALLGHRLIGRVVANRAGHAMHAALVSKILKDVSVWEEAHVPLPLATPIPKAVEEPVAVVTGD
jgi:UDP-3-O-[3-hydroxymyristoyl] N-acetylglucosamine deacetylase